MSTATSRLPSPLACPITTASRNASSSGLLISALLAFAGPMWAQEAQTSRPASVEPGPIVAPADGKRALTLEAILSWRDAEDVALSPDGKLAGFVARPQVGDGELIIRDLGRGRTHTISRGGKPTFARSGNHAATLLDLPHSQLPEEKKQARPGLAVLDLTAEPGDSRILSRIGRVREFAFSHDGTHLAWLHHPEEEAAKQSKGTPTHLLGTELVLWQLDTPLQDAQRFPNVTRFLFQPVDGGAFSYVTQDMPEAADAPVQQSVQIVRLGDDRPGAFPFGSMTSKLAPGTAVLGWGWDPVGRRMWMTQGAATPEKAPPPPTLVGFALAPGDRTAGGRPGDGQDDWTKGITIPDGFVLPADGTLQFSPDGASVRIPLRPLAREELRRSDLLADKPDSTPAEPSQLEAMLEKADVRVWHWRDERVQTEQRARWRRERDQTWDALHRFGTQGAANTTAVETAAWPSVDLLPGYRFGLASRDLPYRAARTWDAGRRDLAVLDVRDGTFHPVLRGHDNAAHLAPDGQHVAVFHEGHWWALPARDAFPDNAFAGMSSLSDAADTDFADEDHDYPQSNPSHGFGGWLADGSGLLAYDRHDIWLLPLDGAPRRLTDGASSGVRHRIWFTPRDQAGLGTEDSLPLILTDLTHKGNGLGWLDLVTALSTDSTPGAGARVDWPVETRRIRLVERSEGSAPADRRQNDRHVVISIEAFDRYPDLHLLHRDAETNGSRWGEPIQISTLDRQRQSFAWGRSSLVSWRNGQGETLQGAVLLPDGFTPGEDPPRPMLIYYYRKFSQRAVEWPEMAVNHRPQLHWWVSNGYTVFLPDINFRVGYPGESATDCLTTGVDRVVELGIADPDRIALHGHSWSGYQTAFAVTRTDRFACAIAGAPVSNMTSAYSGIRYGSGMARQFQYEQSQSRIGASLWERRDLYIDNSPVFFADRINTPLVLMFGDADGAVPWTQGIELYLAMRRLQKPAVFLQYAAEPHHLKKLGNQVDYTLRFRAFVDHFCADREAPAWWSDGVPYRGKGEASDLSTHQDSRSR